LPLKKKVIFVSTTNSKNSVDKTRPISILRIYANEQLLSSTTIYFSDVCLREAFNVFANDFYIDYQPEEQPPKCLSTQDRTTSNKKKPTSKKIVKTIQKQTLINNFLLQENFCKTKTIRFLRKFSTNFSLPPSKNNVLSTFEDFFLNLKKKIICKNGFTLQFAAPPLAKKNLKIFSARVRLCKTKNRLEEKKI